METEEVELKVEDLDKYCEAAASVVEELRDFLASHHAVFDAQREHPRQRRQHGDAGGSE